jgi:hypothetical protein
VATPDGRSFIVSGWSEGPSDGARTISLFEAVTGRKVWSVPVRGPSVFSLDCHGRYLFVRDLESVTLRDALTGAALGSLPSSALGSLGPDADSLVVPVRDLIQFGEDGTGLYVCDRRGKRLIRLGADRTCSSYLSFEPKGEALAWGNTDGTVMVCNLGSVEPRLAQVGLGWQPMRPTP